jgi:flagellar biosynthesis/type III secretory pathway M-ring protein FliF/YscJ
MPSDETRCARCDGPTRLTGDLYEENYCDACYEWMSSPADPQPEREMTEDEAFARQRLHEAVDEVLDRHTRDIEQTGEVVPRMSSAIVLDNAWKAAHEAIKRRATYEAGRRGQ